MINYDYATVSEAINDLSRKGYSIDFNLPENIEKFENGEFNADDFEVTGVYRYEGESDPGDEAIVYAIESKNGVKGVLVSGFGISSNKSARTVIDKLTHTLH
jgi:hypothetical protein